MAEKHLSMREREREGELTATRERVSCRERGQGSVCTSDCLARLKQMVIPYEEATQ